MILLNYKIFEYLSCSSYKNNRGWDKIYEITIKIREQCKVKISCSKTKNVLMEDYFHHVILSN